MNYKTGATLLGLPLVHITFGRREGDQYVRGIARGWIAIGDVSFGILLSVGGVALGGISIGGLSVGVLSIAGLALGVYAFGGLAAGLFAIGGGAFALIAADGGLAAAWLFAEGGSAFARNANNAAARDFFQDSLFFSWGRVASRFSFLALLLLLLPIMVGLKRRKGERT